MPSATSAPGIASAPATAPAATQPLPEQTIRDIVVRLGSASYADRQAASEELAALPNAALDRLVEAYRATDDLEVCLRIRPVAERMFMERLASRRQAGDGFLGIRFEVLKYSDVEGSPGSALTGALVLEVVPDSPAARGGLARDDYIVAVDGLAVDKIGSRDEVAARISARKPGESIRLDIFRQGRKKSLKLTVGNKFSDMPEPELSAVRQAEAQAFWARIDAAPATQKQ